MPRTVDHAQRRAQIAEALVRVAGRDGLHAVTMRAVAAESGVSLRLVQYYFETKAKLILGALRHLEDRSRQRWATRLAVLPDPPPPRAFIEAFFAEALPTDEASRVFHLVGTSYAVLAMTDPELAREPYVAGIDDLERQLTDALDRAETDGQLTRGLDVPTEVAHLLALNHGLGTSVLIGQRTVEQAQAVFRRHLDRLFRARGSNART